MSFSNLQRGRLRAGTVVTATLLAVALAAPATADEGRGHGQGHGHATDFRLTVMGTTDLHGNALNWDYFKDAEYDDSAHNDVGLAKISTLVDQVRADRGDRNTLLLDAGDTIQGTSLAYYYAKIQPISKRVEHPMATAMNAIGYDAAALGNHEFNYGIPYLRTFEEQLDFPLLAANATNDSTGRPAFQPYVITKVRTPNGKPVNVGILGLTNPGIAIWDKANVEGQLSFGGLVEQAARYVPEMRRRGADVVVVSAHSGADTSSSYGDALPFPENAATLVAEQVPGIDAILVGHAHQEIVERVVTNTATGKPVVLSEPLKWGQRLSVFDIDLSFSRGRWTVQSVDASVLDASTVPEDPKIVDLLADEQQTVVDYVNGVIGTSTEAMSAATARYEDTAVLDFINYVQAGAVKAELTGADADLPVLSIAAPFNKDAAIPQGDVSVRDIAGLYIYDNTLAGIKLTGAQVKAYLEKSAEYFKAAPAPGTYAAADLTNAVTPTAPNGTPDYNYDVMGGLDQPLTYDIDLARPVGSRVVGLAYGGVPVTDAQEFVVAINNYRQSGGGNFPGVTAAPVVYNRQVEIRQLLIDWVTDNQVVDPTVFSSTNPDWRLTSGGTPLTVTP
ncbi:bifunctional metallophosphatase/5'-nucleotidase [Cellulomonas xylanilytica]|uniref:Multifunctional 2',3'-cyclic-nucleotide 2'-phosphodiesterase/5'-nucleotidase/3'-nucleotidase n=1 Tax=Cellulomonas xylanilytica TaxID=233583 RepID=A0A510UYW5_9CELL|nr:5'-nucleotidase C-terminal domain-containing protein [Cellulomonas xylanilytica]GEK19847.1 multifunctional 2',3'-cyclic-nucleotide 2'-phosphodiesterase/5'-nucleotidase/3'-nucleotidase [Cellulomonas xylanilytica]